MKVSDDEVRKLAELARLELGEAELRDTAVHLERLLAYVAQLQAIDVPPALDAAPSGAGGSLRSDVAVPGLPRERLLAHAPASSFGLFEVPRVIARGTSPGAGGAEMDEIAP